MSDRRDNPAVARILEDAGNRVAFDALASSLPGTDATSLLMQVFNERATSRTASDLMRQYRRDRFVAPAQVDAIAVARAELLALERSAQAGFRSVALAPLAPLGAHSVVGDVPQNNVVSTARMTEVTADPTNSLALEAAVIRAGAAASGNNADVVDLAAAHRVARAQHFDGPRSFAHFSIFGMISAGRDLGNHTFEFDALERQVELLAGTATAIARGKASVRFTALADSAVEGCETLVSRLADRGTPADIWTDREHGRSYYENMCFKVYVDIDGESCEVGDGGDVYWTQALLNNRKERLVIGGLGLERLVMLATERAGE